ncbi:MAG: capsular polysaccharide biosynthesis protein, partial [Campylobacterales bacterium]
GLTSDRHLCDRRTRQLGLDELVAGALLLYPRYLDPETKRPCEIEVVLDAIAAEKARSQRSDAFRGLKYVRTIIARKTQIVFRLFNQLV